ncbi:MAG: hypothetical protein PHX20_06945 [Candidatus Omnitrophica bacterium]|nr:hypothetical protein [Candidatus Omnitrophota bacterium]MDD5437265.1 hypothetical protein [Candidatus Omnitrophota bacterium]
MRYKTTIKIVTEASDKNEAMEIAGEYLSGNLTSGVDMQLHTAPVSDCRQHIGVALAVMLIVTLLAIPATDLKHSQSFLSSIPASSVIQPPLKTSPADKKFSDFKKEWQDKHAQEVLSSFKR